MVFKAVGTVVKRLPWSPHGKMDSGLPVWSLFSVLSVAVSSGYSGFLLQSKHNKLPFNVNVREGRVFALGWTTHQSNPNAPGPPQEPPLDKPCRHVSCSAHPLVVPVPAVCACPESL